MTDKLDNEWTKMDAAQKKIIGMLKRLQERNAELERKLAAAEGLIAALTATGGRG